MILYQGAKKVIVFPFLLKKLGYGTQGKVYEYKGKALKVPYNSRSILDRNFDINTLDCDYLQSINTKRILLPEDSLKNKKGDLRAYLLELISINDYDKLYNISKDKFLNELYALREEIKLLSKNCVKINDFVMKNFMYDGMFRFVDCGRYDINYENISNQDVINRIEKGNNLELKSFVINYLIARRYYGDSYDDILEQSQIDGIESEYEEMGCRFIGEYVEKTMDKHDTLIEYAKKRTVSRT